MDIEPEVLPEGETIEVEPEEGAGEELKKELTPEQITGIKKRQFTKLAKELGIELPKPKEELQIDKPKGFDYAEKAFLKASDIDPEDFDLVYRAKTAWGETIEETLADESLQAKLKSRKESRIAKAAIPQNMGRSGTGNAKESVDYWLSKGELPPIDAGRKLREAYVEEKRKRSSEQSSHFYNG